MKSRSSVGVATVGRLLRAKGVLNCERIDIRPRKAPKTGARPTKVRFFASFGLALYVRPAVAGRHEPEIARGERGFRTDA